MTEDPDDLRDPGLSISTSGHTITRNKEAVTMSWKAFRIGILALAIAAGPLATSAAAQGNTIFMPLLVYRTGPYAPSGIPIANAGSDYFNLLNERDGGINGVKIVVEECETQYDTKQGVECYERLKGKGPLIVNPYSTGIAYQLVPKAAVDKVVVHSMGYGMTASADGRWFPWVFNFPMTYWSQASAFIKYVGSQEGGMDKLKGEEDRPHLPQQPVREGSQPDARDAVEAARVRSHAAPGRPPRAGAEGDLAPGPPDQPGLDLHLRLGRDEPGRGEGSRGPRHEDGPRGRVTGGRAPRPTSCRPATAPRATSR